jgi:hypothetical protein
VVSQTWRLKQGLRKEWLARLPNDDRRTAFGTYDHPDECLENQSGARHYRSRDSFMTPEMAAPAASITPTVKVDDAKCGKSRLVHDCSAFFRHSAVDECDGRASA